MSGPNQPSAGRKEGLRIKTKRFINQLLNFYLLSEFLLFSGRAAGQFLILNRFVLLIIFLNLSNGFRSNPVTRITIIV